MTTTQRKLDASWYWSIHRSVRSVHSGKLTLMATNQRVQLPDGSEGWRWCVAHDDIGTVASGVVRDGREYRAPVRQAMLEAEQAVLQLGLGAER